MPITYLSAYARTAQLHAGISSLLAQEGATQITTQEQEIKMGGFLSKSGYKAKTRGLFGNLYLIVATKIRKDCRAFEHLVRLERKNTNQEYHTEVAYKDEAAFQLGLEKGFAEGLYVCHHLLTAEKQLSDIRSWAAIKFPNIMCEVEELTYTGEANGVYYQIPQIVLKLGDISYQLKHSCKDANELYIISIKCKSLPTPKLFKEADELRSALEILSPKEVERSIRQLRITRINTQSQMQPALETEIELS